MSARPSTEPPDDAVAPERHPDAPAPGELIDSHFALCFACGADHPGGLRMRLFAAEGLSVRAEFDVGELHQGAPGLAHGGLLAAAFDEVMGALNWLLRTPAVTVRLETDFRRPVPVGSSLHLSAKVVGLSGRKVYMRGEGRLGSPDGDLALTAAAIFVQVPLEHFASHGRPEDVIRAAAAATGGTRRWEVNP